MDRHLLLLLFMIGFITGIGKTADIIAQSSQLDDNLSRNNSTLTNTTDIKKIISDDKCITLIWLEPNETQADKTRVFTIDKYDFWKTFGQLYESSNNNSKTVGTVE